MSAEDIAKAFVQHFYQAFDSNVDSLAGLFVSTTNICTLLLFRFVQIDNLSHSCNLFS